MKQLYHVHDWDQHQHYKDRCPPWIKLHRGLLETRKFAKLSMRRRGLLVQLWLLASEDNGNFTADIRDLQFRLRTKDIKQADLDALLESGLIDRGERPTDENMSWASRYIPRQIKEAVLERDGGVCTACGATENVEFDHIIPVSHGGESIEENLQLLCRSCNRKKRVRSTCYADSDLRSLEERRDRGETETEESKKNVCPEPEASGPPVILLPTNRNGDEYPVTEQQLEQWCECYPGVDIRIQLGKMRGWLLSNDTRRKTERGMPRFITNWLGREQDRARASPRQHKSRAERVRELEGLGET